MSPIIPGIISQAGHDTLCYIGSLELQREPKFREDINKYFADSIKYPLEAMKKKIEGVVYLSSIIEKNGSISNIRVLRSPDTYLSNEAKRVISNMPKWTPGMRNGVPVRVQYIMPVHFKLK